MDRGAWWVIVTGITKSQTQLNSYHTTYQILQALWAAGIQVPSLLPFQLTEDKHTQQQDIRFSRSC